MDSSNVSMRFLPPGKNGASRGKASAFAGPLEWGHSDWPSSLLVYLRARSPNA